MNLIHGSPLAGLLLVSLVVLSLGAYDFSNLVCGIAAGFAKKVRDKLAEVFSPTTGHDHDGVNSKLVSAGAPADGSVTNDKLADDVKVGSLAALTTTAKTSVQAAVNELVASVAAKYTKPGTGIPEADLAAAVQAKIAANVNAILGVAAGAQLVGATVALGGANPTSITFQGADAAATILGTDNGATKALANGSTLIVNPDGAGDDTVTIVATAGRSVSGASPSTDISGEVDAKFNISVDGDEAEEVTLTIAPGLNSGANIAAELQTRIRALGGNKAAVTVDYDSTVAGKYAVLSGTLGAASAVVITPASSGSITEELKLGVADGGTETAGTGGVAGHTDLIPNVALATPAEVAAVITAGATGWSASVEDGTNKIRITSDTAGPGSSLVVNPASTLDTVLGITGSARGKKGLGLAADMADATYQVMATRSDASGAPGDSVAAGNKATTGFDLYCETAGSTDEYDLLILGTPAA